MFYVVHLSDGHEPMEWFCVHAKKRDAMFEAKCHLETGLYPKGIKYISKADTDNGVSVVDACYEGFLVVEQTDFLYHGA